METNGKMNLTKIFKRMGDIERNISYIKKSLLKCPECYNFMEELDKQVKNKITVKCTVCKAKFYHSEGKWRRLE